MTKTLYGLLSQDYREYQLKEAVKLRAKKSRYRKASLKESTNVNIDSAGNVNVSVTNDAPITEPVAVEPEVSEVENTEVIEESDTDNIQSLANRMLKLDKKYSPYTGNTPSDEEMLNNNIEHLHDTTDNLSDVIAWYTNEIVANDNAPEEDKKEAQAVVDALTDIARKNGLTESEETEAVEAPVAEEPKAEEAPAEEAPVEEAPVTEEAQAEEQAVIEEGEQPCKECGKVPCECDASGKKKEPLKDDELIKSSIEEPHEILEDKGEPDAKAALIKIINIIKDEGSIDPEIAKEIAKDFIEPEETTEEVDSEVELEECEISSYRITRIAPKFNAYMLEAQTRDGLRYITGKNFNESEKTLDDAEITMDKSEASNRFKDLLK